MNMTKLQKSLCLFLNLFLISSLFAFAPSSSVNTIVKAQAALVEMAASDQNEVVNVIVQKVDETTSVEKQVSRLGGEVTKDLNIIDAFAAEMTAGSAMEIARSSNVRWVSLDAPVQQAIASTRFTAWASANGTVVANGFTNYANMLSPVGKNGNFGYGSRVKGAFGGFMPEFSPGVSITKVELRLHLYTPKTLTSTEVVKVTPYVGGKASGVASIPAAALNSYTGTAKVGTLNFDITSLRTWQWSDFTTLQLLIDQSALSTKSSVYYDAVGLRVWTSAGADTTSPLGMTTSSDTTAVNTGVITNVFPKVIRAAEAWNTAPYYQGSGVTVAVVDSGNFRTDGLGARLIGEVNFNTSEHTSTDGYGHGSYVAGVIADDGSFSGGQYMGVAPKVNILGLRVADDYGMSYESDVVAAMQWVYDNKTTYNIRVVNLSLNSSVYQSYHTSPLDAAAEILWFNGVVVVTSAGNNGTATLYPPANDPFVITVGAMDDRNTVDLNDDVMASFSAWGLDDLGRHKPDLVAPGKNIIAYLPDVNSLTISQQHPENQVTTSYFRMSGTSVSTPMVSGAAAILLQKAQETGQTLTPDQVKYLLMQTANKNWTGYDSAKAGAGLLDVYAALTNTTSGSANTNVQPSQLLTTGTNPITFGSVGWNSVGWNSVGWNSDYWGQ